MESYRALEGEMESYRALESDVESYRALEGEVESYRALEEEVESYRTPLGILVQHSFFSFLLSFSFFNPPPPPLFTYVPVVRNILAQTQTFASTR